MAFRIHISNNFQIFSYEQMKDDLYIFSFKCVKLIFFLMYML